MPGSRLKSQGFNFRPYCERGLMKVDSQFDRFCLDYIYGRIPDFNRELRDLDRWDRKHKTGRYREKRDARKKGSSVGFLKRNGTDFSISFVDENPCVFETYDLDDNGIITKLELETLLSTKKETRDLFAFIDAEDDDGIISRDEFCAAIPVLIEECKGCCYR